jgi:hypothetical protein
LHTKLSTGVRIVNRAVEYLAKSGNDKNAVELKNALSALKLSDIEVDVNSVQIMLHEEISMLRGAIDFTEHPSGSSSVDLAKLKQLQAENTRLTTELNAKMSAAPVLPPAPPAGNSAAEQELKRVTAELDRLKTGQLDQVSVGKAEITSLQIQITELNKKLQQSASELAQRESTIAGHLQTIDKLNKRTSEDQQDKVLKSEVVAAKTEIAELTSRIKQVESQAEATLRSKLEEVAARAASELSQERKRLETEKDELMEAMAQEVEVRRHCLCSFYYFLFRYFQ